MFSMYFYFFLLLTWYFTSEYRLQGTMFVCADCLFIIAKENRGILDAVVYWLTHLPPTSEVRGSNPGSETIWGTLSIVSVAQATEVAFTLACCATAFFSCCVVNLI